MKSLEKNWWNKMTKQITKKEMEKYLKYAQNGAKAGKTVGSIMSITILFTILVWAIYLFVAGVKALIGLF